MLNWKQISFCLCAAAVLFPLSADAKVRPPAIKCPVRVAANTITRQLPRFASRGINLPARFHIKGMAPSVISAGPDKYTLPAVQSFQTSLEAHGFIQALNLTKQYKMYLEQFVAAKKELDVFAGYQNLEPRKLNMHEIRYYEDLLDEADVALYGMQKMLGSRFPAVHYGKIWLEEMRRLVNPKKDRFIFVPEEEFLHRNLTPGRKYVADEFLLKEADGKSLIFKGWTEEEIAAARKLAAELPSLSVAVLNDDPEILEWVQSAAARGFLGSGTRVRGFSSMDQLVDLWEAGVRFDVVLLDYVLEDGVSLYVANEIRSLGDQETVLFVNSALEEKEVPAEDLFNQGIDGFISSVGFRPDNVGPRLTHALHRYFFYKNKYGWSR